jgi:hypothetical protein
VPATRTKRTVNGKPAKTDPATTANLEEQVRTRAFEVFQTRMQMHTPGDHLSDWLQAERELNNPPVSLRT